MLFFFKRSLKEINETSESKRELFLSEIATNTTMNLRDLKITLVSMHTVLPNQFLIKISPILNDDKRQLLAVGCMTGALLVYDIPRMMVRHKFAVFNNPVVGIEWCTKTAIIVWSHSMAASTTSFQPHEPLSSGQSSSSINRASLVKNEIVLIDIRTGTLNINYIKVYKRFC